MVLTQVIGHCRRLGIADTVHREPHRAA
jgi:hypothetical protein